MLIVQDLSLIDKQLRTALCEFVVVCRRLDRLSVPFVSSFAKMVGFKVSMPRVHVATVKYGTSLDAPVSERWMYRGTSLYSAYDTKQIFKQDNGIGIHTVLSRYHLQGRYMPPRYAPLIYAALFVLLVVGLFAVWRFSPHPVQPVAVTPAKEATAEAAIQKAPADVVMKGFYSIGATAPKALLQSGDGYTVYDKKPVNDRGVNSSVDVDGKPVFFGNIRQDRREK